MIHIRRSAERGRSDDGWLRTLHTFTSGEQGEGRPHGVRSMRAIEECVGSPGGETGMQQRHDQEILTYVVDGALGHNDAMNNGTVVFPGDLHRTSAGRGITGREFNHSDTVPVHFLRFRIEPESTGLIPGYEQRMFVPEESLGRLLLLASRDGRDDSVKVHQHIDLYLSTLVPGSEVRHPLPSGSAAWVQIVRGAIALHGTSLQAGDGAALTGESELVLRGVEEAEVLVVVERG